jgi:hypothetical protein
MKTVKSISSVLGLLIGDEFTDDGKPSSKHKHRGRQAVLPACAAEDQRGGVL